MIKGKRREDEERTKGREEVRGGENGSEVDEGVRDRRWDRPQFFKDSFENKLLQPL